MNRFYKCVKGEARNLKAYLSREEIYDFIDATIPYIGYKQKEWDQKHNQTQKVAAQYTTYPTNNSSSGASSGTAVAVSNKVEEELKKLAIHQNDINLDLNGMGLGIYEFIWANSIGFGEYRGMSAIENEEALIWLKEQIAIKAVAKEGIPMPEFVRDGRYFMDEDDWDMDPFILTKGRGSFANDEEEHQPFINDQNPNLVQVDSDEADLTCLEAYLEKFAFRGLMNLNSFLITENEEGFDWKIK